MPNETEKITPSKRFFSWKKLGFIFTLLLILSLIMSEYFFYSYFRKSQQQLTETVTHVQAVQQQIDPADLQQKMTLALQSIQQLQTDIQQLHETVGQLPQTQEANKIALEWMQASYYVKLANDNLQYINNIPLAITLLKMADDTIYHLSDPKFDEVRKALANDIAHLQSTPQVDVTGIYMRLLALNNQLDQLPLPNKMLNTDKLALDNNAASSNQSGWKRGLQTSWQALQKIVVVRYHESGALPFMTPDQQLFLYQNVHAMISQSMWALLHGQTIIYQKSLQQTINWVKEYFLLDSPVTQAVLNELNELQKIDIHPATPEISGSLQAFTAMKGNE